MIPSTLFFLLISLPKISPPSGNPGGVKQLCKSNKKARRTKNIWHVKQKLYRYFCIKDILYLTEDIYLYINNA